MKLKTISMLMSTALLTGCAIPGGASNPFPQYENNLYTANHSLSGPPFSGEYHIPLAGDGLNDYFPIYAEFGNNFNVITESGLSDLTLVSHIQMFATDDSVLFHDEIKVESFSNEDFAYSYISNPFNIDDGQPSFTAGHSIHIPWGLFSNGGRFLFEAYLIASDETVVPDSNSSATITFGSDGTYFGFIEATPYVFQ